MIAITVSTNYHDILPFILEANLDKFDRWVFVTDYQDLDTQQLLAQFDVDVVLYDFKNNGKNFDKGGGMRVAQQHAYANYPDSWYLILDSDIVLPTDLTIDCNTLDPNQVYGTQGRIFYRTASGYRENISFGFEDNQRILGFFQLYKKHVYYRESNSAADCDDHFIADHWTPEQREFLEGISLKHLGHNYQGWNGRKVGSDFLLD